MRLQIILLSFLLSTTLFSYQDYDIDGVIDSKDRCPNTPFDKRVDRFGCSKDYYGVLTLKIGGEISLDNEYEQSNNLNFFINYRYNQWDLSISNSNYTIFDNLSSGSNIGDTYIDGAYLFKTGKLTTKISLGTKLATTQKEIDSQLDTSTGEDDYSTALSFSYQLQKKHNIFLYYGYTLSGDSDEIDYENRHSYSFGTAYSITDRWYSAISYESSSSLYQDVDSYSALSWFNSYSFSKTFFTTINYSHALDEHSYDKIISLKFGINFK
ncbi:MAG: hypothetical protein U9P72_10255 [Campylobacterota bacterium]|nr:hypothetical protein [Campylobacterota bacterium]